VVRHRLLALATAAVASITAAALVAAPATSEPSTSTPLPWLHIAQAPGRLAQLTDPQGRTVLLHGVNVTGVEDDFSTVPHGEPGPAPVLTIDPSAYAGRCPTTPAGAGEAPLCEVDAGKPAYQQSAAPAASNDFAQMRALGLDFVRLPISWSQLEPTPGSYNTTYLDRLSQVVGWARAQGIYVLLDMHEDNYSRFVPDKAPFEAPPLLGSAPRSSGHADGAPPWAVQTDGVPPFAIDGQGELGLAVQAAFTNFWLNRDLGVPQGAAPGRGLQDHYIGAMAAVAKRFKGDSTVVGYEIMNEPLPGLIAPVVFSSAVLYPFYGKVIRALTGVGSGYRDLGVHVRRQSFFFEPMVVRNLEDAPDQLPLPFTTYPNLVYAPHTYTHVFTFDALAGVPAASSPYPLSYDQAFQVAALEAQAMHAALISGEYGNAPHDDATILANETAAQDRAMVGSALWQWKGNCGAALSSCWSVYGGAGQAPIPSRVRYVGRAYPRVTSGRLDGYRYDPADHSFTMTATATAPGAPTIVFIPATASGAVDVTGAAQPPVVFPAPDGTRLAAIQPTGTGTYLVTVAAS
jgi:endoglycosylceramidase